MPDETFDANDVIAKFSAALTTEFYDRNIAGIKRSISLTKVNLDKHLKDYAQKNIDSLRKIKTIVSEGHSDLLSIYQPSFFKYGEKKIDEIQFRSDLSKGKQLVIRGNAGAGKSIFLRRHFLRRLEERSCIPYLIELRTFNFSNSGLFAFLYDAVRVNTPWLDTEGFRNLLGKGKIELLLDALDEVSHLKRPAINSALEQFIVEFPKARVVLTTRYGDRYSALPNLNEYHLQPFSKQQAVALVLGLDFEEETKHKFASALRDKLYDKNSDLLSNPLLCSIMLLTYRRFADVPDQLHLYYQQAYEVLYSRHDASKSGSLKRDFTSNLDVMQMQSVLDYFSALSYTGEKFEFSESECLSRLQDAANSISISADARNIKDDLVEAVSMLNRDGFELRFAHRSFQEFFCAHYISKANSELSNACIEACKSRVKADNVLPMAFALNEAKFEEVWLIENLKIDISLMEEMVEKDNFLNLILKLNLIVNFSSDLFVIMPIGSESLSTNINVYQRCLGPGVNPMTVPGRSNFVEMLGQEPERSIFLEAMAKSFVDREYKAVWKTGELPKGHGFGFNLDKSQSEEFLGLAVWRDCATHVLSLLKTYQSDIEKRRSARNELALRAFQKLVQ